MPRVLAVGSANVDFTIRLDRLPMEGETVSGGEFYMDFGGKGANQAVAALRAGAEVALIARVGEDIWGKEVKAHLRDMGIDSSFVLEEQGSHTGCALILVDKKGRNLIGVAPGANRTLCPEHIREARDLFSWAQVLLIQLETPLEAVREALRMAKDKGLLTVLNPAPYSPLPKDVLALVDILTPNEGEARGLAHVPSEDLRVCLEQIRENGPKAVAVTMGAEGVIVLDEAGLTQYPGFKVEAIDTTGCGDAFNGALACALAEGLSLREAVSYGNAAGALAATKRGAQRSMPQREEILRFMKIQASR